MFDTTGKVFTGRMPQSGKLPVLNLPQAKNHVFALQGRLVAPIQVKLGRADWHLGPLGCVKFHLNRRKWVGMRPRNIKKFHFLVETPRTGEPLDRFLKF